MAQTGLLKKISADNDPGAFSYRIANLQPGFKFPEKAVKIGDEIKFEIAADKTKDTPGVKSVYRVAGLEKINGWDTVRFSFTAEEPDSDLK